MNFTKLLINFSSINNFRRKKRIQKIENESENEFVKGKKVNESVRERERKGEKVMMIREANGIQSK